ncbi:MAG: FlgD immunoglobulin-like domain containing protein, partial [Gaiellaceae bacterium]
SSSAEVAHTVQAQITATAGAHGQITPSGVLLYHSNDTPSFVFTADATYHVTSVTVDGAAAPLTSPYSFAPLAANHTIDVQFDVNPAVGAIASLASTTVKTGNAAGPVMKIRLTWDAVLAASSVEVYRAPYGNYPEYDDPPASGSVPTPPSYPPTAPWTLTGVQAPGEADTPPSRDFYYYVAFVTDGFGTRSAVSNLTAGSLSYALGDVSDGVTVGMGDNLVDTADLSLLGAHYGQDLSPGDPAGYLDVGPTTDFSVNARPTTDKRVDFEDLMMLAFNYGVVSGAPASATAVAAATDGFKLEVPSRVSAGDEVTVRVLASGTGRVRAISTRLAWAAGVVEPLGFSAGAFLTQQNGVAFSPRPGTVDVAVLGAARGGITGSGELVTVRFRVLAAGDPKFAIASADARDGRNQRIQIGTETQALVPQAPLVTRLAPAFPTPFSTSTSISFSLSQPGNVDLACYSVDGRRVQTLARGAYEPGEHRFTWDGRSADGQRLPAGVYYALLETPQGRFHSKLVIVR